jgi:alpha-L-rhamnosidase
LTCALHRYPLTVSWLHQYFGDVHAIEEHWSTLKLYVDSQRRQMLPSDGVPCFYMWGDWCTPFESRHNATQGTGPPSSAANYIMAVEAMVGMAGAIGQTADEARYGQELAQWRTAYDARFWEPSTGTYTKNPLEVQTITSTALAADVVPAARRGSAVEALAADVVSRDHHLSVGSVGQKWLLNELTANGHHDTALKVAMQDTYPSWGHWLAQGATTCWENWSGVCDESHPGQPWPGRPGKYLSQNPPTHNHIFRECDSQQLLSFCCIVSGLTFVSLAHTHWLSRAVCGGVGEWMHRSLGGIAPAAPGYATVTIAPQVSKTTGPNAVNASIATVRGTVKSAWVRPANEGEPFELKVSVPVGSRAIVRVPLLDAGASAATIRLREAGEGIELFGPAQRSAETVGWLVAAARLVGTAGGRAIELETVAGEFHFQLFS